MEDNEARFSKAERGLLTDSLKEWLTNFQASRPRRSIPTIPLKLANYTIKLQKKPKYKINYFRRWTGNEIIKREKKKAIQAYIDNKYSVTTSQEYISYYQEALTAIKAEMSAGDLKKYDELADKWNATTLPAEVQRDQAEKHCVKYIKEFARQMYRQLGMRVFVLHAAENVNGRIVFAQHDYNEENGSISFTKTQTDWESENIMQEWGAYTAKAFGQADADADTDQADTGNKKGKKPLLELAFTDDSRVMLLEMSDFRPVTKLTEIYSLSTGQASANAKSTVPWSDLKEHRDDYMDEQYLPDGYLMKEPSKMVRTDVVQLINHWKARQAEDEELVVFKGYRTNDGGVALAHKEPEKKTAMMKAKSKQKAKGKATGMASSTALASASVKGKGKGKGKGKRSSKGKEKATDLELDEEPEPDTHSDADADDIIKQLKALEGSDDDDDQDNVDKSTNDSQAGIEQWEIAIQQQLEHPLMIEPNVAPADVATDHDISKYSFLLNVSSRSEYRDMLATIYGREQAEDSPRLTILVAEWCSWSYTSAFLPEVVHNAEDGQEAFFLWLFESAYLNDKGKVISKDHLWRIVLAIGFLLNDIHQRQFSRPDPDGPDTGCVEGTPPYVLQSDIDFAEADMMATGLCKEITIKIEGSWKKKLVKEGQGEANGERMLKSGPSSKEVGKVIDKGKAGQAKGRSSVDGIQDVKQTKAKETGRKDKISPDKSVSTDWPSKKCHRRQIVESDEDVNVDADADDLTHIPHGKKAKVMVSPIAEGDADADADAELPAHIPKRKKAKVIVSPIPEESANADSDADIEAEFNTGNAKQNKAKMVVLLMPKENVNTVTDADADTDTEAPAPVSKRKKPQVVVLPIALVRKAEVAYYEFLTSFYFTNKRYHIEQHEDMSPYKKSRKCRASPEDEADADAEVEAKQDPRPARKRKPTAKALAGQAATAGKVNRRK
ncbi:hypothetical protein EW146_g4795 [Bondarzewia mesenterica]|uniref:Uncharacterized protein n=1 Tax=Bondarzewia mesenterica TaxID=1095465 RepID=A0A4S4LZ67_9AGAM|nr:hypothetical protein EW146_g4795 [Bondarzewia mesenterica]